MPADGSIVGLVTLAFARGGVDLARLGLAWARATPVVVIVPAFGMKALPAAARGVLGVALAAAIFPAVSPEPALAGPFWSALLVEAARGLPVAVAAAVPLWAATMAGNVADALRGAEGTLAMPVVEGDAPTLGVAFSLLASGIFLALGGPAIVAHALALGTVRPHPLLEAAVDIQSGITIAVALAAPLLAASIVVEVSGALVARAATPAQIHLLLAPLRAVALLGVLALVFSGISWALAEAIGRALSNPLLN